MYNMFFVTFIIFCLVTIGVKVSSYTININVTPGNSYLINRNIGKSFQNVGNKTK